MGLLDDYNYESGIIGLGMSPRPSRPHQVVMSHLVTNLNNRLPERLRAISEPGIEVDAREKAPDIGVFDTLGSSDPDKWRLVMFIEIVKTTPEEKRIRREIENVLHRWSVKEALIYNYVKKHWVKCTDIPQQQRSATASFSDVLHIDLAPLAGGIIR